MKHILITGANSYVGTSVESHLNRWPEDYQVDTLDMIGDGWREKRFSSYDAVLHVAGIVHQPQSKDDPAQAELYDRVNHRLAVETAQKAKAEGVKQFLFMSSASVYGLTASVGKEIMITADTPLVPVDNYGISKKNAEESLKLLADDNFKLAILRPPMIYGKGCKGNYVTLAKLAKKLPAFPWVNNRRSMLYIENLAEFIRLLIDDVAEGVFCPQNETYVNTSDLVNLIAHANGKGILLVKGFGWMLKGMSRVTSLVDKAFGSLCYDYELSRYPRNYWLKSLSESVVETEQ
ncbi:MAG: NAD-dependent epimerase/dehydratase family protein [Oscillospiraceae bacterium]|nr:NAD-dependent epimerase/dehydratase family protein [Oscillospiraceae bacterium]